MKTADVADAARKRLSVDTRALAAFRLILAVCLLVDLSMRARDLRVFYTDAGVLPRDVLAELFPGFARFSLHALSGGVVVQVVLLCVSALAAVALAVGLRPRLAGFVSLVLHVSLYTRNPYVLNGGDTMLIVLLLLAVFLPLGARWSVDGLRRDGTSVPDTVLLAPAVAVLLFIVVIYTSNAVLRYRGEPWMSGEAVRRVFGLETVTVLLGPYLAELPLLLEAINWAWVAMLTVSVLLVILVGGARAALTASFVAAHVAMALTLRLGVFPLVVIAGLVMFFPPVFWDRVEERVPSDSVVSAVPHRVVALSRDSTAPTLERFLSYAGVAVAVTVVAFVLVWQGAALGYVGFSDGVTDPDEYAWKMYSPTPQETYGWYFVPVELASGERVDGLQGGTVDAEAPPDVADAYPSTLWYRYLSDIDAGSETRQRAFADWVCGTAREHGEPRTVELRHVERRVVLDGSD
ncbi:MAG: HTTM domain-containing protein, partial [Halobacteriales archaeon]